MQNMPLFAEIDQLNTTSTSSWISEIGFDIARQHASKGWIVLIDPVIVPTKYQWQFYGINPKQVLVVRSTQQRDVEYIIQQFSFAHTASLFIVKPGRSNLTQVISGNVNTDGTLH